MKTLGRLFACAVLVTMAAGCGSSRVHILPDVQHIHRVAVINLADKAGKPSPESEFFTNEFVSVGFSVVERGHLQDVIKEAFTSTGYVDERSVAQWGRGLGIDGVVLHQIMSNNVASKDADQSEVMGWVRIVDVESGQIVLTYNIEVRAPAGGNSARAAKFYSEQIVDDLKAAMKQQKLNPTGAARADFKKTTIQQETTTNP